MLYIFPFGLSAWLAGIIFIDRKSKASSQAGLAECGRLMTEEGVQVLIFPEGTRNTKPGFLPFKRGAFISSIKYQVPIIPCVVSPYYFVDNKTQLFNKGHIIYSILDPIYPKELSLETDVDSFMEKTRTLMLDEYIRLTKEIELNSKNWETENKPRLTLSDREVKQ